MVFAVTFCVFAQIASGQSTTLSSSLSVRSTSEQPVRNDLKVLGAMHGQNLSALGRRLFKTSGGFNGAILANAISQRLGSVHWGCGEPFMEACFGGRGLGVTPKFFNRPFIERVSILLHEASHANGSGHTSCPSRSLTGAAMIGRSGEDLTGKLACDSWITGAYVKQIVFLRNLAANCDTCSASQKAEAQEFAESLMPRIIEPSVYKAILTDR